MAILHSGGGDGEDDAKSSSLWRSPGLRRYSMAVGEDGAKVQRRLLGR